MKLDTSTILLLAAAGVGVYLLTRPKTTALLPPTYAPMPVSPYTTNPYYGTSPYAATPTNATAQDIAAGGSALSSLASAVSNFI